MSTIHDASVSGNTNRVRALLNAGVSLNSRNTVFMRTALHYAAEFGHLSTVRFLINRGAEVNALDAERRTPLMNASIGGHLGVVRLLISHGARLNTVDFFGATALMYASSFGHPRVVRELILGGANTNIRNQNNNQTARNQARNNATRRVFNNINRATATVQRIARSSALRRRMSHARRRAPARTVAAAVFHPARVNRMGGSNWLNQL